MSFINVNENLCGHEMRFNAYCDVEFCSYKLVHRYCSRLVCGRCSVPILSGNLAILTEAFRGFPLSLQAISKIRVLTRLGHDHFFPNPI
jgi:hypothetical protein